MHGCRARPEPGDAGGGAPPAGGERHARRGDRGTPTVRRLVIRRTDLHVPPALRRRSAGDPARACTRGSPGRHDCRARVRSAARRLAPALGALRPHRPPTCRTGDLAGLGRGRRFPRAEHQELLRGVAGTAARRALASRRDRGRELAAPQSRRRNRHLGPPRVTHGDARPAFYALAPGGWRDYVTLLHPPYTLWHLSYVAIGAALAPQWRPGVLALALVAFFLGMGIGAHALDELHGRPLETRIPARTLAVLAVASLAAAAAIGIAVAVRTNLWLLAFVGAGAFIAVAYNLELFGGRLHGDPWFSLAWGAFPVLTAYFACAETIRIEAVLAAAFAALLSHAQRRLSTPVRLVRRRTRAVKGSIELLDGSTIPITADSLTAEAEHALKTLSAAAVALALALVLLRVT